MNPVSRFIPNKFKKFKLIPDPINRNDRVGMLHRAWGYVFTNLIKGAYYEFGLYQGDTFLSSWEQYLKFQQWAHAELNSSEAWRREALSDYTRYQHEFYGFDTFAGIPDNTEGNKFFQKGNYACSQEHVQKKCATARLPYQLFKGLFADIHEETLRSLQMAAIVNIDGDLYLSAKDALEKVRHKFQQGTILLMDYYNCFSSDQTKGERLALKEFCEEYSKFYFEPWYPYLYAGQSFICHVSV